MGSEMCIRDRLEVDARPDLAGTCSFVDQAVPEGLVGVTHPHDGFCLLYTSDAADERSSVDLGGRRIIKKKKH